MVQILISFIISIKLMQDLAALLSENGCVNKPHNGSTQVCQIIGLLSTLRKITILRVPAIKTSAKKSMWTVLLGFRTLSFKTYRNFYWVKPSFNDNSFMNYSANKSCWIGNFLYHSFFNRCIWQDIKWFKISTGFSFWWNSNLYRI